MDGLSGSGKNGISGLYIKIMVNFINNIHHLCKKRENIVSFSFILLD